MIMAIVLAGGAGTRIGGDIPKQYLIVEGKPIIGFCLETLQENSNIDQILIVCSEEWQDFIQEWIEKLHIMKFCSFAESGESRQHSIYRGLLEAKTEGLLDSDLILIHDAARPMLNHKIINECIEAAKEADGAMPVITVKDTIYCSRDGKNISRVLNRDELFAGQAPECFRFGKYFNINHNLSKEKLNMVRGSSEIAHQNGMHIRLIEGDESNYKITTLDDLAKFKMEIREKSPAVICQEENE